MKSSIELIREVVGRGGQFVFAHGQMIVHSPEGITEELLTLIKGHREQIEIEVERAGIAVYCTNLLTSHSTHELPWECNPETCPCYRIFRYPRFCEGVKCRWVWPERNPTEAATYDA